MERTCKGIYLERELVTSKAWLALGSTGKDIFLILRLRCQMSKQGRRGKENWSIDNNGELVFTYAEAKEKYSITATRFTRGIDDLLKRGFVDVAATGRGVHRLTTHYAISNRWRNYGTPHFKQVERLKRSSGYPGFKKKSTNENISVNTNENVSIGGESELVNTNDYVRRVNFKNILKWRNNKWIRAKSA